MDKIPVVLISGTRYAPDSFYRQFSLILDEEICHKRKWITEPDSYGNYLPRVRIVAGGAKGIDDMAASYAMVNWTNYIEYKADWETHGKKAGPIRNQEMLDTEDVDLIIAFPGPKSKGTWDMINRAKKAGIEVIIHHVDE